MRKDESENNLQEWKETEKSRRDFPKIERRSTEDRRLLR